jgi:hypothetical protein
MPPNPPPVPVGELAGDFLAGHRASASATASCHGRDGDDGDAFLLDRLAEDPRDRVRVAGTLHDLFECGHVESTSWLGPPE